MQKLDQPLEQLYQSLTTKYLAKETRNETEVGTFTYNINSMLLKFKDLLGFLLYSCPWSSLVALSFASKKKAYYFSLNGYGMKVTRSRTKWVIIARKNFPFMTSLRGKRFRLVSEQRKTEEQDSRFWPRVLCFCIDIYIDRTETLATQAS